MHIQGGDGSIGDGHNAEENQPQAPAAGEEGSGDDVRETPAQAGSEVGCRSWWLAERQEDGLLV